MMLSAGGDLSPETLIYAYQSGIFPMVSSDEFEDQDAMDLVWWSPQKRGVVPLDNFLATRSMRRSAKNSKFVLIHVLKK